VGARVSLLPRVPAPGVAPLKRAFDLAGDRRRTPSQMNVWLWILQRAPTLTPRWISTNVPTRVPSPRLQP
jgi:hypothetical protein